MYTPSMLGSSYRPSTYAGYLPSSSPTMVYAPVFGNVTVINQINLQVINNIAVNSPGAVLVGAQQAANVLAGQP